MQPKSTNTPADPVQAAPARTEPDQPIAAQPALPPIADEPAKPVVHKQTIAELEAAHAKAHKRLSVIETVGIVLLVFVTLSGLAIWAFYQQQTSAANAQPYSTNEYQ